MRKVICIFISFVCLAILQTRGQSTQEKLQAQQEKRKEQLEREIRLIDAKLSETSEKSRNELTTLKLINKKLENRSLLLKESQSKERALSSQISVKQKEIRELTEKIDVLTAHYEKLVLSAYKNRDTRLWYMYILASENLGQAFRRYGYFKSLSSSISKEAERIYLVKSELEQQKQKLDILKSEANLLSSSIKEELTAIEKEKSQSQKLIASLNKQKSRYQQQLAQKRREVQRLNTEIAMMVRKAMNSNKSSGIKSNKASNKTVVDEKLSAEFSKNKSKLPWPVEGVIVEHFGQNYHPIYKNVKLPFNNGVNIEVKKDEPVRAIFDGVVQQIVVVPGYNQCVLVQHGSYFSFYCKLKTVNVKAGQKIYTGENIGTVDTMSGETQLHFQIWKEMTPQNPELWLKK